MDPECFWEHQSGLQLSHCIAAILDSIAWFKSGQACSIVNKASTHEYFALVIDFAHLVPQDEMPQQAEDLFQVVFKNATRACGI